jgi:hypothetical protein
MSITKEDLLPYVQEDQQSIMTTITNHGYLLYTLNMLKSLAPFGLDKKVFIICLDARGAAVLRNKGYHVHCAEENRLAAFCPWNTKGYDKICYLKLETIYRILLHNFHVLMIDGDIVFHKNPLDDLTRWQKDTTYDVWIQNDSLENWNTHNMCTGYIYIKASDTMRSLYDCISDKGRFQYGKCAFLNNDQTYFNQFVKPHCKMNPLPLEHYPNGNLFYKLTNYLKPTAVLVHFNWVKGHEKMAKMKEHKMWLLTPQEEI